MKLHVCSIFIIVAIFFVSSFGHGQTIAQTTDSQPLWSPESVTAGEAFLNQGTTLGFTAGSVEPAPIVTEGSRPWLALREGRTLSSLAGRPESQLFAGQPVSLTMLDFDRDGYVDLAVGFTRTENPFIALYRANPEAYAPVDPVVLRDLAKGRTVSPFLPVPGVVPMPDQPDFLVAGDFDRDGIVDLVTARRGDSRFWFLQGQDGAKFRPAVPIELQGLIRVLISGELGIGDGLPDLLVGLEAENGGEIDVFEGTWNVLAGEPVAFPLPSAPIALSLGDLDGLPGVELAVAVPEGVWILSPRSTPRLVALPVPPRAILVSDIIWDREVRAELAILDDEGTLRILERGTLDPRPWASGDITRVGATDTAASRSPEGEVILPEAGVEFHERWRLIVTSPRAGDDASSLFPLLTNQGYQLDRDLIVLDAEVHRVHAIMPPRPATRQPSRTDVRHDVPFDLPAAPLALLPMRLNILPEQGIVAIVEGVAEPLFYPPAILSTITVNTTADTNSTCATLGTGTCSLRDAIRFSNTNSGTDTIVFSGSQTITLTQANSSGINEDYAVTGDLDITDSVTITGNGSGTIIRGGTNNTNGIDKVFAVNPFCDHVVNATMTGMTIRFGRNTQPYGAGDYSYTGGGLDWCGNGAGTFTFNNNVVDQNTNVNGYGGGVNIDTASGANGTITMTGTTVSSNTSAMWGGGINVFGDNPSFVLNGSSLVTGNTILGNGTYGATGGGLNIRLSNYAPSLGTVSISSSTVSNNTSFMVGGGICICVGGKQNVTIQNSTISGNTSQKGQGNAAWGGGLSCENPSGYTTTLTNVTVSSNHADLHDAGTAPLGGGILNNTGTLNMSGGSIANNTVGSGQTLGNGGGIAVNGGTATLSNLTTISGNTAKVSGGAVAVLNTGTGSFTGLTIQSNTASTSGGAFYVGAGSLTANLCRVVSNTAPTGSGIARVGGTASVENNWWECDGFPGATGCQSGSGTYDADPRIDLRLSAVPTTIVPAGTSTLTADVIKNTNGANTNGGNAPAALVGLNFTFVNDAKGSINTPLTVAIPSGGTVTKTFTAGGTGTSCGAAAPGVTLDNGTQTTAIQIQCPDVVVSKSGPSVLCSGSTITYNLTATNNGDGSAAAVSITDDLADCLTSVNCTPSVGTCLVGAGNVATASLGAIASAGTATVTITGTVAAGCPAGLTNAASIATTSVESNSGNNSSTTVSTTVNTPPSISVHPSNSTICAGTNTTFSVTAGGTSLTYQWQLDSGSGFSNLLNGGVYSNVLQATMTITGATAGMNGYRYRCVVSGTCTPPATSNPATLSVNTPLPTVGGSLMVSKNGSNLVLTWTDITGAADYAVYEDSSPSGTFATLTGTAVSGVTGLSIAIPAGDLFYKVAGRNSCGTGPLD